ncbi:MAG TPA: alpha/beta hydrolase [Micropepsaceae bacterium]|jgi:pimeloyl-ACP methyl ester carboxylesterase
MICNRFRAACFLAAAVAVSLVAVSGPGAADDTAPLALARDGYFYVNARTTRVGGKTYVTDQMYVEERVPARRTHAYPIVMVHGGTMSGVNFTGTPDGREGWAQYFVRQGYAVYVVDQPGRGRSGYLPASYGPARNVESTNSFARFVSQEKSKLWPQAVLHTQWPGSGNPDDPAAQQVMASQLPAIESFEKQQFLNRDALIALFEKIGPGILMVHSQAGAFAWPVADARPDLVRAILAIEPNGPPVHSVDFIGAPNWFKEGPVSNTYLQQAGIKPSVIRLADLGIHGNSHVMMLEKNNQEVAAVIAGWLDKTLPKGK